MGGDITDESTSLDELKYIYEKFSKINNNYGIFFVYGNHDGRSYENTYYNLLENVLKENLFPKETGFLYKETIYKVKEK